MPRVYKRKLGARPNKVYDPDIVAEAVSKVINEGMSQKAASSLYNIPRTNLRRRLKDINIGSSGRKY